jgi:hypothetical protein
MSPGVRESSRVGAPISTISTKGQDDQLKPNSGFRAISCLSALNTLPIDESLSNPAGQFFNADLGQVIVQGGYHYASKKIAGKVRLSLPSAKNGRLTLMAVYSCGPFQPWGSSPAKQKTPVEDWGPFFSQTGLAVVSERGLEPLPSIED